VSLTVNDVGETEDTSTLSINLIPHTAHNTTFGELKAEQQLNVEVDVLARYIARMLAARAQ
jgi:riboflavin synthase